MYLLLRKNLSTDGLVQFKPELIKSYLYLPFPNNIILTVILALPIRDSAFKTGLNVSLVLFLEAYSKSFHAPLPKKLGVPPTE